jgi:CubicO group peptidase (beta-lactamase class C family)
MSGGEPEPTPPPPPDTEWEVEDPAGHGFDPGKLAEIDRRMAASQMLGAVIIKDGVIVDEFYQEGYDKDSLFHMHSVTKSVMGALTGIAIEQGLIESVDARLADIYPQLNAPENAGKEAITVEHLLTHTAGLSGGADASSFGSHVRAENWVERYLSLPLAHKPGEMFSYSTAGSHILADLLEKSAGMSAYDFAVENLFAPLGIENFEWGTDPQGVVDGGNGLYLTVRDAARLGQLYLDGGSWRGLQLVPREWVEASVAPHAAGEPDKGEYGYQWWVWSFGGHEVYYALGYAGQFVFAVPDLELVVAIASKSIWSDFTGQVCIREVIGACEA